MAEQKTYKDAGVDIEKAEQALSDVKGQIEQTYNPRVLSGVGLFGGFYDLSNIDIQNPVLVSSTDGVGTKLKVAILAGKHTTVGQDLVNHCINDIAVCGARPLFFLDYFASGELHPTVYQEVISGLASGCRKAGVPLIGGETAEMPDFYGAGDYDMCGTIVGIADKTKLINGRAISPGDVLIGVASNGLHTNGYTLARNVLLEKYTVNTVLDKLGCSIGEELLRIHLNYYPLITQAMEAVEVRGVAHITGGGLVKNTQRLLREGLDVDVDWSSWELPAVFELIQSLGNVPTEDMRQAFNMGIGLVLVVPESDTDTLLALEEESGHRFYTIGEVVRV